MQRLRRKDDRVVVIGAGAAGLSVAHRLAERGYRRVTVLEASERVGGKCWSVRVGGRTYEMGAIGFPGWRNTFRRLAESTGVRSSSTWTYSYMTSHGSRGLPHGLSLSTPFQSLRLLRSLLALQRSGFAEIDSSLAVPMTRWLDERGLHDLGLALRPLVTGLGYGFFHDVAAAYALKHVALFRPDVYQLLDDGAQSAWERVARTLDVRLDHPVERVERSPTGRVRALTKHGTFEGEWLFVATPPAHACAFLDAGEDELRLLRAFRCFRYHALLCDVTGLSDAHYGFFPDAHEQLEPARPVAYSRRSPRDSTSVLYSYLAPDETMSPDTIVAANQAYLAPLGARIHAVHRQHTWEYFPHLDCNAIAEGVLARIEDRQGERSTYYVGEALAYPTVRHVVDHAFDLVDRCS